MESNNLTYGIIKDEEKILYRNNKIILNYNFFTIQDYVLTAKLILSIFVKLYDIKSKKNFLFCANSSKNEEIAYIKIYKYKGFYFKKIYLNDIIKVFLDTDKKDFKIIIDKDLLKKIGYKIKYKILGYSFYDEKNEKFIGIEKNKFIEELKIKTISNHFSNTGLKEINFTKMVIASDINFLFNFYGYKKIKKEINKSYKQ